MDVVPQSPNGQCLHAEVRMIPPIYAHIFGCNSSETSGPRSCVPYTHQDVCVMTCSVIVPTQSSLRDSHPVWNKYPALR